MRVGVGDRVKCWFFVDAKKIGVDSLKGNFSFSVGEVMQSFSNGEAYAIHTGLETFWVHHSQILRHAAPDEGIPDDCVSGAI